MLKGNAVLPSLQRKCSAFCWDVLVLLVCSVYCLGQGEVEAVLLGVVKLRVSTVWVPLLVILVRCSAPWSLRVVLELQLKLTLWKVAASLVCFS